jgi:hypothetical protein
MTVAVSALTAGSEAVVGLGMKANYHNNGKDKRCVYDVKRQCPLRKSKQNISFCHNFTPTK